MQMLSGNLQQNITDRAIGTGHMEFFAVDDHQIARGEQIGTRLYYCGQFSLHHIQNFQIIMPVGRNGQVCTLGEHEFCRQTVVFTDFLIIV